MISLDLLDAVETRMELADKRYGPFASTHEALGVAYEEWGELREAIHQNDLLRVQLECLDLAAVLIRLTESLRTRSTTWNRSLKSSHAG